MVISAGAAFIAPPWATTQPELQLSTQRRHLHCPLTALESCRELKESTALFKRAVTNRIGYAQLPGTCTGSCSCTPPYRTGETCCCQQLYKNFSLTHHNRSMHACMTVLHSLCTLQRLGVIAQLALVLPNRPSTVCQCYSKLSESLVLPCILCDVCGPAPPATLLARLRCSSTNTCAQLCNAQW